MINVKKKHLNSDFFLVCVRLCVILYCCPFVYSLDLFLENITGKKAKRNFETNLTMSPFYELSVFYSRIFVCIEYCRYSRCNHINRNENEICAHAHIRSLARQNAQITVAKHKQQQRERANERERANREKKHNIFVKIKLKFVTNITRKTTEENALKSKRHTIHNN